MLRIERQPGTPGFSANEIAAARLCIRSPVGDERRVDLRPGRTTLGSSPRCDLRIPEAGVHPLHLLIVHEPPHLTVRRWAADARLNGHGFEDSPLVPGDRLTVGSVVIEIEAADSESCWRPETAASLANEPDIGGGIPGDFGELNRPGEPSWEPQLANDSSDSRALQNNRDDCLRLSKRVEVLEHLVQTVLQSRKELECQPFDRGERQLAAQQQQAALATQPRDETANLRRDVEALREEIQAVNGKLQAWERQCQTGELTAAAANDPVTLNGEPELDRSSHSAESIDRSADRSVRGYTASHTDDRRPTPDWSAPGHTLPEEHSGSIPTGEQPAAEFDWSTARSTPDSAVAIGTVNPALPPGGGNSWLPPAGDEPDAGQAAAADTAELWRRHEQRDAETPRCDSAPREQVGEEAYSSQIEASAPQERESPRQEMPEGNTAANGSDELDPFAEFSIWKQGAIDRETAPGDQNPHDVDAAESVSEGSMTNGTAGIASASRLPLPAPAQSIEADGDPWNRGTAIETALGASVTHSVNSQAPADDEESIEQYMAKLLQRVRGDTPHVPASQAPSAASPPATRSAMQTAGAPVDTNRLLPSQMPSEPLQPGACQQQPVAVARATRPKMPLAEQAANLEAFRALANESAHRAISTHALRVHRRNAVTKVIVATLAGTTSVFLMLQAPDWRDLEFITACLLLLIAAYWAGQTFHTMIESFRAAAFDGPEIAFRELADLLHPELPIDVES